MKVSKLRQRHYKCMNTMNMCDGTDGKVYRLGTAMEKGALWGYTDVEPQTSIPHPWLQTITTISKTIRNVLILSTTHGHQG